MAERRKKFVIPDADHVEQTSLQRPQMKPLFKSTFRTCVTEEVKSGNDTIKTTTTTEKQSIINKPEVNKPLNKAGVVSKQFGSSLSPPSSTTTMPQLVKQPEDCALTVNKEESTVKNEGMTFAEAFADLKDTKHYRGFNEATTSTTTNTTAKSSSNSLIVNTKQKGNPILKHIRNVSWEYGDIVPDYVMGKTTCALFLSIRYHNLKPDYIHDRLKLLGHSYELRILLVQVDVKDPHYAVKDLTKIAMRADCTLILAWTPEEAGRYLETYKSYENKPADTLKERVESDFLSRATDCLTTVKKVNKTDVVTLLSSFQSMDGIIKASKEELSLCPGFGPQKAHRLHDLFYEPFLRSKRVRKDKSASTSKDQ